MDGRLLLCNTRNWDMESRRKENNLIHSDRLSSSGKVEVFYASSCFDLQDMPELEHKSDGLGGCQAWL